MEEELRAVARMLAELTDRRRRLLNAFLSGVLRGVGRRYRRTKARAGSDAGGKPYL